MPASSSANLQRDGQLKAGAKRPRGNEVTFKETRKSWDEVDKRTQKKRLKVVLDVCEKMKVPPVALVEPSTSPQALSPEETYVELPRPCQRKVARRAGAKIASERQIRNMRLRDADEKGIRVLVALRDSNGAIVHTEDEPEGNDIDFSTITQDSSNNENNIVQKERITLSDISQRRLTHIDSGRISLPPTPRLCHRCGRPSDKYLNNNQPHQCIAPQH